MAALAVLMVGMGAACLPSVSNPDGLPGNDRFVFNSLTTPDPVTKVHDVATVRITNNNKEPFTITGVTFTNTGGAVSAEWALVTPDQLPAVIAGSGSLDVPIRFLGHVDAGAQSTRFGRAVFATDLAEQSTIRVTLAGVWDTAEEVDEPRLAELVEVFGYKTQLVAEGNVMNNHGEAVPASPDEIISTYWAALDPSRAVTVRQLAAFHTGGTPPDVPAPFGYFSWVDGATSTSTLLIANGVPNNQTVLPADENGTPKAGAFTPTGPFTLKIDGASTIDADNYVEPVCATTCGHHVRFWQLKNSAGHTVPGSYIVAMDYAAATNTNYDYNDNVYLITNIAPAAAPETPPVD